MASLFVVVNPIPPTPVITLNVNTLTSNAVNGNQWYNLANGAISNATAQTYMPQQIGNYFVIVSLNGCSSDSSNIIYFDNTGIDDVENNTLIKIYPVPAFDKVFLDFQQLNGLQNTAISIYNIQGQMILQQTIMQSHTELNITQLAKGMYIVKVSNDKKSLMGKFVKE